MRRPLPADCPFRARLGEAMSRRSPAAGGAQTARSCRFPAGRKPVEKAAYSLLAGISPPNRAAAARTARAVLSGLAAMKGRFGASGTVETPAGGHGCLPGARGNAALARRPLCLLRRNAFFSGKAGGFPLFILYLFYFPLSRPLAARVGGGVPAPAQAWARRITAAACGSFVGIWRGPSHREEPRCFLP